MKMETDSHIVLFCVMRGNVQVCQGCNLCSSYNVNSFRKRPNSVFCKLVQCAWESPIGLVTRIDSWDPSIDSFLVEKVGSCCLYLFSILHPFFWYPLGNKVKDKCVSTYSLAPIPVGQRWPQGHTFHPLLGCAYISAEWVSKHPTLRSQRSPRARSERCKVWARCSWAVPVRSWQQWLVKRCA